MTGVIHQVRSEHTGVGCSDASVTNARPNGCARCIQIRLCLADDLEALVRTGQLTGADSDTMRRLVGPSQEQVEASLIRLRTLDQLWNRYSQKNIDFWPAHARESYRRLEHEQARYENIYL
jgi:hypothetical protein